MTTESTTPELEDLRAWVDGELDESQAEQIQQAVTSDPELSEMVASLRASQLPYSEAVNSLPAADVPVALRQKIDDMLLEDELQHESIHTPFRGAGLKVASLAALTGMAIAGAAGYFVGSRGISEPVPANASVEGNLRFAQAVASYQGFYVRETVANTLENNVSQLTTTLSEQSNLKVQIPDFSAQGLQFVRAQQLGYEGQPVVQLVYLGDNGLPVAFCYMPEASESAEVKYEHHFGMETAEWVDNEQRFVIVAKMDEADVSSLYQAAQNQLQM